MQMTYWKHLRGIQDPVNIRQFSGIDKRDAFSIADGAATSMKNLTSANFPTLTGRPGFSDLGATFGAAIVGLGVWKDAELHAIGGGDWKAWSGTAWGTALASSLSASLPWSFCNFQGNLAAMSLLGVNGSVAKKYNGTTVAAWSNVPSGAKYCDAHDNRVYVAAGQTLYYCALRKPEDWSTANDAGSIVVETADGTDITGLRAGPGHVVVFKAHSMFELYGNSAYSYKLQPVSDKVGCVANNSAIMVGDYLYFLAHDSIYRYSGGVAPSKVFSQGVQWYVDNINQANRAKACAGTDGKRLYMTLPIGTATEPSHVLEYDPTTGIWCVWELGHYPRVFAFMAEAWYEGDSSGAVHLMGGTTDAGTAIAYEWISKPFGSGTTVSEWHDLWVAVDCPVGSTMSIYLSGLPEGDTDWVLAKAITPSASIQAQRIYLPIGSLIDANWLRLKLSGSGPASIYELTRQERILRSV